MSSDKRPTHPASSGEKHPSRPSLPRFGPLPSGAAVPARDTAAAPPGAEDEPVVMMDTAFDALSSGPLPAVLLDHYLTQPRLRAVHVPTIAGVPVDEVATTHLPAAGTNGTAAGEEYTAIVRRMLKSSGVYALGALTAPLVTLVLAPFLTHHLSPSDYGVLAIVNTAIALAAGITQLGLGSAFFRSYNYEFSEPRDRRAVISTTTLLLGLLTVPVALLVMLAAPAIAQMLLQQRSYGHVVALAAGVIIVQNLTVPGFAWMRAENKPQIFVALSLTNLLVTLGATIALVGVWRLGISGAVIANGAGYAVVALLTLPVIFARAGTRLQRDAARSLITFGAPQVLSLISYWILQVSDRTLLGIFGTHAEVASYAVAYTLGTALAVVAINPFQLAWPAAMYAVAKRADAAHIYRLVFRYYGLVLTYAAFGVGVCGQILLDHLFPPSYRNTALIIPVVALSLAFYGCYILFMTGASVRRILWMPAAFTTTAALANVGLNLVLIPRFGSMGAAASTLIAYIVLALVAYVANQRVYPVPYELGRFALAILVGVVFYSGSQVLAATIGGHWVWAIAAVALVVYGIVLLALAFDGNILRFQRVLARGSLLVSRGVS